MAARTGAGRLLERTLELIQKPIQEQANKAEQLEYDLRHNTASQTKLNTEELDKIKSKLKKIKEAVNLAKLAERAAREQKAFITRFNALYKTAKTGLKATGIGTPVVTFADANEIAVDLTQVSKNALDDTADNLSRIVVTIPKNIDNIERLLTEQEENIDTSNVIVVNDPIMKKWVIAKKESRLVEFWKESKPHRTWVDDDISKKKYNLITREARLRGMYPISLD